MSVCDRNKVRELLEQMGFVRVTGFDGEAWTNPKSRWMAQVWVISEGGFRDNGFLYYDARNGFNFREFFKWWEDVSMEDHIAGLEEVERRNS